MRIVICTPSKQELLHDLRKRRNETILGNDMIPSFNIKDCAVCLGQPLYSSLNPFLIKTSSLKFGKGVQFNLYLKIDTNHQ